MRTRVEKTKPKGKTLESTSNPKAPNDPDMTARMHFYAVHNLGDQIRWASAGHTNKRSDRMVGR